MKIFFDTEFMENGKTIELLSIGMVTSQGATFYAENSEADWDRANDWVRENVIPLLVGGANPATWLTREELRDSVLAWVAEQTDKPEFWAYFADYDWVVLCQLFGRMVDLPEGWPKYCRDIKQVADMLGVNLHAEVTSPTDHFDHNAMHDAEWNKEAFNYCGRTWARNYGTLQAREIFGAYPRNT